MAVRVGADNDRLDVGIVQYFVEIAGEMDMGINGSLFFPLGVATKNMRDMPAILAVKYIRQMVTGMLLPKPIKAQLMTMISSFLRWLFTP